MISSYFIKRHNLIERILKIIVKDISKNAANGRFTENCIIRERGLDNVKLEFENGNLCLISLEPKTKKIRSFKHIIEINISVRVLSRTYRSTINLLDLKNVFTHLGFKFDKYKLEDLLYDELVFLHFRIKDIIGLANKNEGVEEMEKVETFVC